MKTLILSDQAFGFLCYHFRDDGKDLYLNEKEMGNKDLAMTNEVTTALTAAGRANDY